MGRKCTKLAAMIVVLAMVSLAIQIVSAGEPELSDAWAVTYEKGTFLSGAFGDYSGDSADDLMAIFKGANTPEEEESGIGSGEHETYLVLFDGYDGSIVWERNFTDELEPLLIVCEVEMDGDVNALVYMSELTEVPVANTDYNYTVMMSAMSMIEGGTGDILWTSSNLGTMDARTMTIEGEDIILAGGISTFDMNEGGLYTINPENGHYRSTGINYDTWLYNFLIEELPNGDDAVIVYGNQAIEAYEIGTWDLIWEYDFFDNDVYSSSYGYSGLLDGDGTVAFNAGKGDNGNSLIVLDKTTGEEISATNLTQTGISVTTVMWSGNFNGDEATDYLAVGFTEGLNYNMMAIDGGNMSEMWRLDAEEFIIRPESSNLRIIDLDGDGTEDVLVTMGTRVLALSGKTGEIIMEHELPAEPDFITLGNAEGQPNLAYGSEDTLYCMNLDIPTTTNSIYVTIIGIVAILIIATAIILLIRRRR